ncbi:hypothetical protein CMV_029181 [Castanea mollissima]|uniref:Reverse transcriptase zinc-binding domain-containing protein n=1 Tax=Castanea mollissima TaxID=60419 RepID=A0A8J4VB91_9ROSI|nr:hypothetical protein CMV_029181 [Castanea mollissima]
MENSKNGGWADVLRTKYMVGPSRKPKAHTRAWKAVQIGRDICGKGSKWMVGCNSFLSFWNDKWLNIGTIRSFNEGPLNRGEGEVCIKDVTMNNGWDLANLSFTFPNHILKAMRATPLRRFAMREDHRNWISSLNGDFDSRNAYLLAIDENLEAPDFHGKWIWKLQTLPKIKLFLWKCLHMSLQVKDILTQGAKIFWEHSSCPNNLKHSFSDDLVSWIKINAFESAKATGKDYDWCNFFLLDLWNLWLQRNRKAFRQQPSNPNLVQAMEMQKCEFMYCVLDPNKRTDRLLKQVKWLKPAEGWHKLNTDGSFVCTSGLSGCGGLPRDCAGQWVVGFAKTISRLAQKDKSFAKPRNRKARLCIEISIGHQHQSMVAFV